MTVADGVVTCTPDWWRANGTRLMAERPVRLVRLTSFPDDRAFEDAATESDPRTGHIKFGAWPGIEFTFPPGGYDPGAWDYERNCPVAGAGHEPVP